MATKKQPTKPARTNGSKPAKGAKPAPKAVAKKATSSKAPVKVAAKPASKAVAKKPAKAASKPAAKKPAPAKASKAVPAKTVTKLPAAGKKTATPVKKTAVPAKKVVAPAKKVVAPAKKPVVPATKAALPAKKTAAPVKSPATKAPAPKQAVPEKKAVVAAPQPAAPPPPVVVKTQPKKLPPKPTKIVIPKTSTTKVVKYEPDFTKSVLDSQQKASTGPTMRYPDSELVEFRELIMKKLETAKKELAYLQGLITRKDEGGDMEDGRYMTMEDGSMSMEREQLSQMASRQIQFIDHLEKAIMRIENKTYGICRVTGKLIDKARLRAVPHATLSIEAKQMMNK
jgi:RNA polymerase-binding transcription factor DksA